VLGSITCGTNSRQIAGGGQWVIAAILAVSVSEVSHITCKTKVDCHEPPFKKRLGCRFNLTGKARVESAICEG
jgi:hypothetical protein